MEESQSAKSQGDEYSLSISEETVNSLLDEVLKATTNSNLPSARRFKAMIRDHVAVDGFRPGKAPIPRVHQVLLRNWGDSSEIKWNVVDVWCDLHPDLLAYCRTWLKANFTGENNSPAFEDLDKLSREDILTDEILADLAANFSGAITPEKVELAIFMVIAKENSTNDEQQAETLKPAGESLEKEASEKEMESPKYDWNGILDTVGKIPADDPGWKNLNDFIDRIKTIGSEKGKQLELEGQASLLKKTWTGSKKAILDMARYLEFSNVEAWSIENVDQKDMALVIGKIEELDQQFKNFNRVNVQPDSETRAARTKRDQERVKAEESIQNIYAVLAEKMMRPAAKPAIETSKESQIKEEPVTAPDGGKKMPESAKSDGKKALVKEKHTHPAQIPAPDEAKIPSVKSVPEKKKGKSLADEQPEISPKQENPSAQAEIAGTGPEAAPRVQIQDNSRDAKQEVDLPEVLPTIQMKQPTTIVEQVVKQPTSAITDPGQRILECMRNHDFSTAYWLAWSLESQGKEPLYPSQLIAALQGAIWSIGLWPEQLTDLLTSITNLVVSEKPAKKVDSKSTRLLRLAAGIYFNLVDPMGRWAGWLEDVSACGDQLFDLVNFVQEFNAKGIFLEPGTVRMVVNSEEVDLQIAELTSRAKQWVNNATSKGAKFFRSAQVWQELVRPPKGELYKLINCVVNDRRDQLNEIEEGLSKWQDRTWLDKHIQEIDQELRQTRGNKIVGPARDQIIGWTEDICGTAQQWCSIIRDQEDARKGHNWKLEQTGELCKKLTELIHPILTGLDNQNLNELDQDTAVASAILCWILKGLQAMVSANANTTLDTWPKPRGQETDENSTERNIFEEYLAHALMYYTNLDLSRNGIPQPEEAGIVEASIMKENKRSPEDAIQDWINLRDYRFIKPLVGETADPYLWETRISEAIRSDASRLSQNEIGETMVAVEQALLEGIIGEEGHTDSNSKIESIRKQIRQTEKNGEASISFRHISQELQKIRDGLDEKRQARQKSYKSHWERLVPELPKLSGDDPVFLEQIKTVVEASLNENDLRATGEYLAHLDHSLTAGALPERTLFERRSSTEDKSFQDFNTFLPDVIELLEPRSTWNYTKIRESISREGLVPLIPMDNLPRERRDEVVRALDAWRRLKADGPDANQTHLACIPIIMSYLGFSVSPNSPVSPRNLPGGLPSFQWWRVSADVYNLSPVAQFGSLRNRRYDVMGAWHRPGFEIIESQVSTLMQQTGNNPTILLYFHYLTPAKRELLLSNTRKNNLPILVIDEGLMLFLARYHDTRIKPMFRCTLPYAAINPYFPSAAGRVPPEVYKGREDLVKKLQDPFGPAIVYGGRQLGKSALLRQVEREFDHKENGQYVIYEDIKTVGDLTSGKNYQSEFRDRFANALINLKLIEPQRGTLDLDRLANHLHQQVLVNGKRLLLLLDEADNFLDADAGKNFQVIQKLKDLMDQTGRNFKIILAGLHNVQRFQRISNQPLAHLETIKIGPLEPRAARDLLVEPLRALGYSFGQDREKEDNSLVLHILSYTNYHPGLIQLFGSYLYQHLISKYQQPGRPPQFITRPDVEAVYRNKDVRDEICKRFNWTLALDPRYEAIALALIFAQWDDQNGFDRLYTSRQLHDLAKDWWPDGFGAEITTDRFKTFLDEMQGLGVLSITEDSNTYRLRSPNLVYLMGTYEQLLDRMDSLNRSIPPGENAMESFHARVETGEFSPLDFANERALNNQRSGVALIFGSRATDISNLDNALRRLVPEGTGAWKEIKIASHEPESMRQQLKAFISENPKANFLLAYRELDCDYSKMEEEVSEAIQFCGRGKTRVTLRVVFGLDSQSTWEWLKIPREERESIKEQVEAYICLRRWDQVGIKQRLEMEPVSGKEIMASDALLGQIIDITGGWPNLLDEFTNLLRTDEPDQSLGKMKKGLSEKNSALRNSFISSLEIFENLPKKFMDRLLQEDVLQMLAEGSPHMEVLKLAMEDIPENKLEKLIEYFQHLSIISMEPKLSVEKSVSRAWHAS